MNKKEFIKNLQNEENFCHSVDKITTALKCDFFESDVVTAGYNAFDALWVESFGSDIANIINWWLFADCEKIIDGVKLETIEDLANFIYSKESSPKKEELKCKEESKEDNAVNRPQKFQSLDDAIAFLSKLLNVPSDIRR